MTIATTTEVQNNFGRYLQYAMDGCDVIILKNGKEVARLISKDKTISFLTDELVGVLKKDYNEKEVRKERVEKHESIN